MPPKHRTTLRRYKVFRAHLGFYDVLVAAPSRHAALQAWGVKHDLFKDGMAEEVSDPKLMQLATSKPYVPFRRLFGSRKNFEASP